MPILQRHLALPKYQPGWLGGGGGVLKGTDGPKTPRRCLARRPPGRAWGRTFYCCREGGNGPNIQGLHQQPDTQSEGGETTTLCFHLVVPMAHLHGPHLPGPKIDVSSHLAAGCGTYPPHLVIKMCSLTPRGGGARKFALPRGRETTSSSPTRLIFFKLSPSSFRGCGGEIKINIAYGKLG